MKHKNRGVTARVNGEDRTDSFSMPITDDPSGTFGDGPIPRMETTAGPEGIEAQIARDTLTLESFTDPFLAEDMTFRTTHSLTVINLLNTYLNDFRKAHPNAALLQMIPTGPASFTFVWEL